MNDLNEPQLKAVTSLEGAILIIAGAGSGKTRVITYRIARMLEKGIPQSAILALTFTNKAAREMESRVKELTGKKLQSLTLGTFHAFGVKVLREEIEILGYRKNFSIYDSTDKIELIKECLKERKLFGEKNDLKKLETIFSNVKIGRQKWGIPDGTGRVAQDTWEPAYSEYHTTLQIFNALDFDDLLVIPIKLFEDNPDILEKYRRRYRYILVDEFQDTSIVQYKLLRLLANPEGGKSNICVVGDDDQSIYSWRGANYGNTRLFEKDFPNALEIKLEQNYRSTTTILEAANGLISHNSNRKGKNLWSGNGEGKPIIILNPQNESDEAAFIAGMIKRMRFSERRCYGDFGVLVRTNNQFDCIEEAFLAENIPYRVSGGMSFFERKEIRDILSYLRVIANHNDDVNLLRIINTPRRGIGKASIQGAAELAKKNHSGLYDALYRIIAAKQQGQENLFQGDLRKEKSSKSGFEEFFELIQNSRDDFFGSGELSKKVRRLVDNIDYWGYLVIEHSKDEKKARWKFSNIEYFIRMIEEWEKDGDTLDNGLYAYLNRISLLTRTDGEDDRDEKGKTNLMTIHASKGLEFPVVFIAGAEEGTIPHEKSLDNDEDKGSLPVEEERRLFYVAITRAREKLYISSCQERRRRDTTSERFPSPFLAEIPPGLIDHQEEEEKIE
ncbi:MAG: UvrD-helicase domain-containing protein, partial [Treponema sp.]|nr:UvrD-helicase domain-containing protein [Treponema sp.]